MEKTRYSDCYIAFIDILGFKEMINNCPFEEIFRMFRRSMKMPMDFFSHDGKPVLDMSDIHMKVMSDSVCFSVDRIITNSLVGLVATCLYFQVDLLRQSKPVLSRGAITHGKIYADGDILFGPGFVKAYLMEEKSAKYPRIIMTKETMDAAREQTAPTEADFLPKHTFIDFDEFYTIDSCKVLEGFDDTGKDCACLLSCLNQTLATSTDSSIREKNLYLKKNLLRWYRPGRDSHT